MDSPKIVGIMLIRNEDLYIERVIRNVAGFCDRIIITDHQSEDGTYAILRRMADEYRHIEVRRIASPRESALAIEPYINTPTWIFAVDGDEIFDPAGLKIMRERLQAGAFSDDWCIFPNTLICTKLDPDGGTAWGHLAPPSRAVARLYNFSLITAWKDCPERLHGDQVFFKEGFSAMMRRYLHKELTWENSYFRYLHLSLMKRSTLQKNSLARTRLNPAELLAAGSFKNPIKRLAMMSLSQVSRFFGLDWKNRKYRQGPVVEKNVSIFFQ